jgi:phosphoenolpyruvate synthase/pyruvate phosphate dikinase
VGADEPRVAPLSAAVALGAPVVGNKAANLARLGRARMRAPDGFCITVHAYSDFVRAGGLVDRIRMEIGRKALEESRWEELWDAAHRIRAAFLSTTIPEPLAEEIRTSAGPFLDSPLAVRSSAPGEDSATRSHAGLHESVVDVRGEERLLRAVRVVWASLWSDASLLYRRETGLDPRGSRMAVVVQRMVEGGPSGVAFSRDPRDLTADRAVVEAVPGPCRELVDGEVDPDRYTIRRTTGDLLDWRRGDRPGPRDPLLREALARGAPGGAGSSGGHPPPTGRHRVDVRRRGPRPAPGSPDHAGRPEGRARVVSHAETRRRSPPEARAGRR